MNKHVCELPSRTEEVILEGSVTLKKSNFRKIWEKWCCIDENTPRSYIYMESMADVAAEKRRHANLKHWWIIHPFSYVRFLWESLMILVYTIGFLTIPFMISFVVMDHTKIRLDKVNIIIYTFCWMSIFFKCITGYNDRENMRVELEPLKIFKNYLKNFLIPDVLSSLPYDHLTLPWRRLPGNDSYHSVVLINLLPLLKLTRYTEINRKMFQLFTHWEIENFYYQLCTTLLLGMYLTFWFACLCYLLAVLVRHFLNSPFSECKDCWVTVLDSESIAFRFQHAFFIVLENISASGYGLFIPRTNGHILLSNILMLIGRLIECYIIVMFLQVKADRKASQLKFQEIINQLLAYTCQKQLPAHMKIRLLAYYHYRFKNSYFREKFILSTLSEQLRQEIALQSCRRLVGNVAIFKSLPKTVLQSIVKNLKFELYLPNDVIVKAGTQGDCMFFLSTGSVAVLTPNGKEICHLEDGAHFGEVALLVPDQRRVASIVAIEVCEVYRLDRKDFRKCIAVHTELFAKIERTATERIERAVIVEEQHKHHVMRPSYVQIDLRKRKDTNK